MLRQPGAAEVWRTTGFNEFLPPSGNGSLPTFAAIPILRTDAHSVIYLMTQMVVLVYAIYPSLGTVSR